MILVPRRLLLAVAALLAVGLPAQRTWIVDEQNGPGTDFVDLQPAVDAAAPGDTILVRPDDRIWPHYWGPILDGKGIRIVGEGLPWVTGRWVIRNLPVGQQVVVTDFEFASEAMLMAFPIFPPYQGMSVSGFECRANRGTIILERIRHGEVYPGLPLADPGPGMWFVWRGGQLAVSGLRPGNDAGCRTPRVCSRSFYQR